MRVAVLSLCRDRLAYTQACFDALEKNAGCEYTHFALDQGSTDDTFDWLFQRVGEEMLHGVFCEQENIGIARGINLLLDYLDDQYDVIVKLDNDCEFTQPNTLRDLCETVLETDWLLSPRILGLLHPPQPTREVELAGETLLDVPQIGGICLAAPAWVYDGYRYPPDLPKWGLDDVHICQWYRQRGGSCGYVKRLEANHYLTTAGQQADLPDYFTRKHAEMAV